jgi:DNA (cytosine-5)-methyltransferase 1
MGRAKRLRAIDLYSGVGGWALGLQMAGIKVVASYEWSAVANETNFKNNHHAVHTVDIRELSLDQLPPNIDVVVGSPPCTQFSFSNRGGSGDIADGLVDIIKFLSIVDYLKPRHWVMENVPRVAKIIEQELRPRGKLRPFAHLLKSVHVVNMESFGLPQRRRRCLAGNLDFALLQTYELQATPRTLGDVVRALVAKKLQDPLYGQSLKKSCLRGHIQEDFLDEEEVRINKASKRNHPIYNRMPFPDSLARSARTITATSTRVSRESVVIRDLHTPSRFRRLTIRESACLQGFPIAFQFFGKTHNRCLEMVGNAFPPVLSFYIAQTFKSVPLKKLATLENAGANFRPPAERPTELKPERCGKRFSPTRTFRFAIPDLRLKSGVRFELANVFGGELPNWRVAFYFGTSKSIETIELNEKLHKKLARELPEEIAPSIFNELETLKRVIRDADISRMQETWAHTGPGTMHPFELLDRLSFIGRSITSTLQLHPATAEAGIELSLRHTHRHGTAKFAGVEKLKRFAPLILSGLLVGSVANEELKTQIQRANRNSMFRHPEIVGTKIDPLPN